MTSEDAAPVEPEVQEADDAGTEGVEDRVADTVIRAFEADRGMLADVEGYTILAEEQYDLSKDIFASLDLSLSESAREELCLPAFGSYEGSYDLDAMLAKY